METIAAADLIIESIVEDLPLKRGLVTEIGRSCSKEAILTTNSSYFLPSAVFQGVPHPERIASLHFHVPPWFATAVDIMPTMRTSPATMDALEQFIVSIGLTPIRLLREFPGYIFNSLLHPLLVKSLELEVLVRSGLAIAIPADGASASAEAEFSLSNLTTLASKLDHQLVAKHTLQANNN